MESFVIDPTDKHYPQADNWMWHYCVFLGKFTDSTGKNYDLGVHIDISVYNGKLSKDVCDATVHSNEPGNYTSGDLSRLDNTETREWKLEVIRRARILNLL